MEGGRARVVTTIETWSNDRLIALGHLWWEHHWSLLASSPSVSYRLTVSSFSTMISILILILIAFRPVKDFKSGSSVFSCPPKLWIGTSCRLSGSQCVGDITARQFHVHAPSFQSTFSLCFLPLTGAAEDHRTSENQHRMVISGADIALVAVSRRIVWSHGRSYLASEKTHGWWDWDILGAKHGFGTLHHLPRQLLRNTPSYNDDPSHDCGRYRLAGFI